jgi:hypothetical protein
MNAVRVNKLTEKQKAFVEHIAQGVKPTAAARLAGYAADSSASLRVQASRNLSNPAIHKAAFADRERQLHGPLAKVALATLSAVMQDESAPAAARIQAARWTLESAGHGLAAQLGAARLGLDGDKPISQLSIADLEAMAEAHKAAIATLRDVTPSEAVDV